MITQKLLLTSLQKQLQTIYPSQEASEIAYRLLEVYLGISKIDIALNPGIEVDAVTVEPIDAANQRLLQHEPLQYVVGKADFYDLIFKVTADVLIPRPETEELVRLILDHHHTTAPSLLEIGTGSGCIPITLKKHLPAATITACDISKEALAIATANAELNNVEVGFFHCDILNVAQWNSEKYNIIVSNPPYVLNSEKELMRPNVLDFEPHLALFVADIDPLLFYRTIADFATKHLTPQGYLYFEINEAYGQETRLMLQERGFVDIRIHQDIFGKERMLSAQI